EILGIGIYDEQGRRANLAEGDQIILVRISVLFQGDVQRPNICFLMKPRLGLYLTGTNTLLEGYRIPPQTKGSVCTAEFRLQLPLLSAGCYSFTVAIADGTLEDYAICDWVENAFVLEVIPPKLIHGLLRLPCEVQVKQGRPMAVPYVRS